MKKLFAKGLSAMLIAALLLTGTALMDEIPAEEILIVEDSSFAEESAGAVEEAVTAEPEVEEVAFEPVDAEVEETEAALVEEAEEVEDMPAEEIAEASEPLFAAEETETVAQEESEASAKLMEGEGLVPLDEAHFPDAAFRQRLTELYVQGTVPAGTVPGFRPDTVERLELYKDLQATLGEGAFEGYGIISLQGIEYFTNLKWLDCRFNPIASLDVSMLKNLEVLYCYNCGMTSLNVAGCTNLSFIYATQNALTTLDISGCSTYFAGFPSGYKRTTTLLKKQGIIVYARNKQVHANSHADGIYCDSTVTIVCDGVAVSAKTGKKVSTAPAVAAAFIEVPGAVPATVTVDPSSTAKNTKASVIAAPGSAMQLDLSGAAAKKFKSSKKKVATVDKLGIVYFKKGGKTKITYKVGKQTRKVTLTVVDPTMPTAIALDQAGTVAAKKGDTVALTATLNEGAVSAIKWKSSNKKVATVNNGVVTFKKAGKVTITAITKRGKKKARVTFVVAK